MIRSMTGYCSLREALEDGNIILEMKALNHKGFDVHFHAPRMLSMLEMPTRECIQQNVRRGRLEVYLRGDGLLPTEEEIRPNVGNAQKYIQAAETIATQLNIVFQPNVEFLLTLEGVLDVEEQDLPFDETWKRFEPIVNKALSRVLSMKVSEGEKLKRELETLLDSLTQFNSKIEQLRQGVVQDFQDKMLDRIAEWNKQIDLDENRVMQEVAFYVDRSDIQEEIVRLYSHLSQFKEMLNENSSDKPYKAVGRRLDFLCQEMFREINTMGSKSTSTDVVKIVLEMKSTVDQIREQVQNVE